METGARLEQMRTFMAEILAEIGPRPSCSEASRALARRLAELWRPHCQRVEEHTFTCRPAAMIGVYPYLVLGYLAALVLYFLVPAAALVISGLCVAVMFLETVRFREFVDFLFPTARGSNVLGVVSPRGPVRRRVVVSAHLDSAYEFTLWWRFKNLALPLTAIAVLAFLLLFVASGLATAIHLAGWEEPTWLPVLGWLAVGAYPVVGLFFFFHCEVPVPGANDDLSGIAVLVALSRVLGEARAAGRDLLRGTEVVLLACDAEEAGLRGSRRFVKEYRDWLGEVPTWGLFLDGLGDERHLTVLDRETFLGVRHDPALADLVVDVATAGGYAARRGPLVLGGTDAASFSQAGLPAVCVVCQDTRRLVPHYHTRYDTLDVVRPEALAVSLRLSLDVLDRIDGGELDPP